MNSHSSTAKPIANVVNENNKQRIDLGHEFIKDLKVADSEPMTPSPKRPINSNEMYEQFGQPFVTTEGFITMFVAKDLRVDINTNQSIRVITPQMRISVDSLGHNIGVQHPSGRVLKEVYQNTVHIESGYHLAKMSFRGITFTSLQRTLVYLVDTSGCKSTAERFRTLNYDFISEIFKTNALTGDYALQMSYEALSRYRYESSDDSSDSIWFICGIRIRLNHQTGDLMITNSLSKIVIHVNPDKDQLKITSPQIRIMANYDPDLHLQVIRPHSREEQRISTGADNFRFKYGSQKAGFDANDQLVLF